MINAQVLKILTSEGNDFIATIRDNLASTGTDATKESSNSLYYTITEEGAKVVFQTFAKPYFSVVETGRKPTPDKKPSRDMIDNIKKWGQVRGNSDFAWAIATVINQKGSKLWQKGGRTDIYTDEKESFADRVFTQITEDLASELFRKAEVAFT